MNTGTTTSRRRSSPHNPADLLQGEEMIQEFILGMLEEGDERLIPTTLRTVADAVGMTELAKRTRLDRSNLYSALSEGGNPRLDTVAAVVRAFGLKVTLVARVPSETRPKRAAAKRAPSQARA